MATRLKKISVTLTPGHNEPVDNVIRLEDLLREMCVSPPLTARGRAAPAPAPNATQALVLDLESRLRAARASVDKGKTRKR